MQDPKTSKPPEDLLAHMSDRQLWERAVRTADHAYHVATTGVALGRDNQRTLVAIAKRVGVLEKEIKITPVRPPLSSDPTIAERFAIAAVREQEQEIDLRNKKWDTALFFTREATKWLFVGGGGAGLYALVRYLLG
jgi:hypothetical protein